MKNEDCEAMTKQPLNTAVRMVQEGASIYCEKHLTNQVARVRMMFSE